MIRSHFPVAQKCGTVKTGRAAVLAASALILAVACAGCMTGQPAPLTVAERAGFVQRSLENGLVILCQEDHAAPIAVVQVYVRAGSLFEQEYSGSGISHFCEHIIAGGTTGKRTETETRRILDSLGGESNAFTSSDGTTYYIQTTAAQFDAALELVADWTQNSAFTKEEYERERKVIEREIEMRRAEPGNVLWDLAAETAFPLSPAKYPVIGHKELFLGLTRDDLLKYYRRMYIPDNMFVVAVGDFKAGEVADRISSLFKAAPRGGHLVPLPQEDPPQLGMRAADAEMDVKAAYVTMRFRTVPLSHPDLYALDVMSYVLSQGGTSRLVQRLREDEQLADEVSTFSYTPWTGPGRFDVQLVLRPENADRAKQVALEELERLKQEIVGAAELARAKKQFIADHVFERATVGSQASLLGINYLSTGNPFYEDVYLRGIAQVKAEEIRRVAREYLSTDNLTVVTVRPLGERKAEEQAASAPAPETKKFILPNGLRVLVRRDARLPVVTMQAYFIGGLLGEDDATAGTSNMLGLMLTAGTRTRTAYQVSEAFDGFSGTIAGGSGRNTCFLRAEVLSADFEKAFRIFADCLANPVFPEEELEKTKNVILNAIEQQNDDWFTEVYSLAMKTLYRNSPYRLSRLGTPDSVKSVTRDGLARFHRRTCTGFNGVVAIFGDVDVSLAEKLASRLLGELPSGKDAPPLRVPRDEPPAKNPAATQHNRRPDTAAVYVAYQGCELSDVSDCAALMVLDAALSGADLPAGRLHEELRGQGLVYLVHADSTPGFRTPGHFGVYAVTRPEKVDQVIGVMERHVERLKKELVPVNELELAKKMVLASELFGRQTNSAIAQDSALNELYGFGHDFSAGFQERIRAVTGEDVRRVAQKYLTGGALAILKPGEDESQTGAE